MPERKFLVSSLPATTPIKKVEEISQDYLASTNGEYTRIRLVKNEGVVKHQYMHFKKEKNDEAWSHSFPIERSHYFALSDLTKTNPLRKTRKETEVDGQHVLIDIHRDKSAPLILIKVRFINSIEADDFIAPDWFGKEVTDKKEYEEVRLWESIQN